VTVSDIAKKHLTCSFKAELSPDLQASNGSGIMNKIEKTLLMVRALDQATDFVAELDISNTVMFAPMVKIKPLNVKDPTPTAHTLIFTSSNAVRLYACRTQKRDQNVLCVGSVTQKEAENAGFTVLKIFETAQNLISFFETQTTHQNQIIYPRAQIVSLDLVKELMAMGYVANDIILYQQTFLPLPQDAKILIESSSVVLPVLSQEIAKRVQAALICSKPDDLTIICISPKVAAIFDDITGVNIKISPKPDRASLLALVKDSLISLI
jgi:uroporphyrinogen-III synthase